MRPQKGFAREATGHRGERRKCLFILSFKFSFTNHFWVRNMSGLAVTTPKPHGALLIDLLNNAVVMGVLVFDQKNCISRQNLQNLTVCRHHLVAEALPSTLGCVILGEWQVLYA